MIKHSDGGHVFFRDVQEEITRRYPYLKIESPGVRAPGLRRAVNGPVLSDTMTVHDLEKVIEASFGVRVQVFRRSGKFWIETRMTRDWSLKRQNDHGRDLSTGLR